MENHPLTIFVTPSYLAYVRAISKLTNSEFSLKSIGLLPSFTAILIKSDNFCGSSLLLGRRNLSKMVSTFRFFAFMEGNYFL